jgi:hypothetical protein
VLEDAVDGPATPAGAVEVCWGERLDRGAVRSPVCERGEGGFEVEEKVVMSHQTLQRIAVEWHGEWWIDRREFAGKALVAGYKVLYTRVKGCSYDWRIFGIDAPRQSVDGILAWVWSQNGSGAIEKSHGYGQCRRFLPAEGSH